MNASRSRRTRRLKVRRGRLTDLDALIALERAVFSMDLLSRRSFRHFLKGRGAALFVAEADRALAGYVLVLYPPRSKHVRLYSIAVAPHFVRRGVGTLLLAAAETAARRRGCKTMRLEVHEHNTAAIARYEKSDFCRFGRHRRYYDDGADALRFEKALSARNDRPPQR